MNMHFFPLPSLILNYLTLHSCIHVVTYSHYPSHPFLCSSFQCQGHPCYLRKMTFFLEK